MIKRVFTEKDLAAVARQFREKARVTRAQAARELGVAQVSIFRSEEKPEESLTKLRIRVIERYSRYKVKGPFFSLA